MLICIGCWCMFGADKAALHTMCYESRLVMWGMPVFVSHSCRFYYDCLMKPNSKSVVTALRKVSQAACKRNDEDICSSTVTANFLSAHAFSDLGVQQGAGTHCLISNHACNFVFAGC